MNKQVNFQHLGVIDYQQAWDIQDKLFNGILDHKKENKNKPQASQNHLLFCEHTHVYTLGKSGNEEHLLINNQVLKEKGAQFFKINRGGDITYHGPGQLVAYPILDLDNFFTDIHRYLRFLEEAVILTLQNFGIESGRIKGLTGVWVNHDSEHHAKKICAFGVRSSRWVTMHGLALNVNTDLQFFEYIVPCGIEGKQVTSIQKELGRAVEMKQIETILLENLSNIFEMEIL